MNTRPSIAFWSLAAVLLGCWLMRPCAGADAPAGAGAGVGAGAAAAAGTGAGAAPGAPYGGLDIGNVIIATVTKVSSHAATNAHPPRVELAVHEVLRGDPRADRSRAVWDGRPSDVDWAGPGAAEARKRWENQPVTPPKVGSRWILWGQFRQEGRSAVFHIFSHGRFPFSEAARDWAVQSIRTAAEKHRAIEIQQAAVARLAGDPKAPADAVAAWRAHVSSQEIERYTRQSDLVIVATLEDARTYRAPPVALQFRVEEVLEGRLRDVAEILTSRQPPADRPNWLTVSVSSRVFELLDRHTRYVLFLSEDGLEFCYGEAVYRRIDTGDGLVIADDASLRAVRKAAGADARKPDAGKPIMMLQVAGNVRYPGEAFYVDARRSSEYREALIGRLRKAAQGRYVTFPMTGFPPGVSGPTEADRPPPIQPNGNMLVMLNFEKRNQLADAPVALHWWVVRGGEGAMQIAFSGQATLSGQQEIGAQIEEIVHRLGAVPESEHPAESSK